MRQSVFLLVCSLAGVVLGAAMIARWAVGLAVIADSVAVAGWALWRDVPERRPQAQVYALETAEGRQAAMQQAFEDGGG